MKKYKYMLAVLFGSLLFLPEIAVAHCPLCTVGAGAFVLGAAYYGVNISVLGVFIGAFAIATGMWVSRLIKKNYIPYQKWIIILSSFILTVLPLMPMMQSYTSLNIFLMGEYGSLLNSTYLIDLFLVGSILGGIAVFLTMLFSKKMTKIRGKAFPFQTISLILLVIILTGGITQVMFYQEVEVSELIESSITNLNAEDFSQVISDENVFVLDVHVPEQEHIKGTDVLIPYNELELNIEKLPVDKSTPIAIYCRSGSMSGEASETLKEMGYTTIYNLEGGANAWRTAGLEFEEVIE